ncbi:MAG: sigma-54-dependent transcriptional regulator [Thiotrichales bacterium]
MSIRNVLVIDDEPDIRELLEITLARMGLQATCAENVAAAKRLLDHGTFDLCLSDMRLPDGNGLEIVEHIQRQHPGLPVAVITAHGNMETAIQALKAGAFDFVSKPVNLESLRDLIQTALKLATPARESKALDEPLLGNSLEMQHLRETIRKVARSQAPVYIHGESGTGKELVARQIHRLGPRAERPFVAVNCGAIPSELMESEFFGHRKGSFTGASRDHDGLFRAAHGGTLFLDEVADLPLNMQVKLLRAIQERAIRPIGEQQEQPVDVRVLSASHKQLAAEVAAGRFRQDLFYRLNVIEIAVPPLRGRIADIADLTAHFLAEIAARWQLAPTRLTPAALDKLTAYPFPGNVRELENILERSLTLSDGGLIDVDDLVLPTSTTDALPPESLALAEQERRAIVDALESNRWNRTAAAKKLGLTLRQLRYRIQRLGLE